MRQHDLPVLWLETGPVLPVIDLAHQLVHHLEVLVHFFEHAAEVHLWHSHVVVLEHRRHPFEHIRHSHVKWLNLLTELEFFVEGLVLVGVSRVERAEGDLHVPKVLQVTGELEPACVRAVGEDNES